MTGTSFIGPKAKFVIKLLAVLLILHFIVEATGHHYLYRTLSLTVFKGKLGPDIEEYKDSPNRLIAAAEPQPWPQSVRYNQVQLSGEEEAYHDRFQSVSFLVIHRDSLLFEKYWEDFGPDTISNSFSMAKSIVGLLTGIAIDQGKIEHVNKPVYWYLPQYDYEPGRDLTIKHLLTMSAGIDFREDYLNPFAFPARANYGDNLELLVGKYKVTESPGRYFDYQSGSTQILAFAVMAATRSSLSDFASRNVWQKIGAENPALWSLDRKDGSEKAFCCINATARDFARIGKVYKDHGRWNDVRIVDSAYIAQSVAYQDMIERDGTPCRIYGYSWWLGEHRGLEFFFMRGIKGQYVLVVPAHDLIVVRMGRYRDDSGSGPHPNDVYSYLDMGLKIIGQ